MFMEAAASSGMEAAFIGRNRKGTFMIRRREVRRSCAGIDFLLYLLGGTGWDQARLVPVLRVQLQRVKSFFPAYQVEERPAGETLRQARARPRGMWRGFSSGRS